MENLKVCPKCGHKSLIFKNNRFWHCDDCDFTLYHNIAGAVAVIIRYQDEILFTRRNKNPQRGKLDLAGGFIDPNETAERACQREIEEELSLAIDMSKLRYVTSLPNLYNYKGITYHTIDLFYEYKLDEKPVFTLEKEELQEVVWVSLDTLDFEKVAFESQKIFFRGYK